MIVKVPAWRLTKENSKTCLHFLKKTCRYLEGTAPFHSKKRWENSVFFSYLPTLSYTLISETNAFVYLKDLKPEGRASPLGQFKEYLPQGIKAPSYIFMNSSGILDESFCISSTLEFNFFFSFLTELSQAKKWISGSDTPGNPIPRHGINKLIGWLIDWRCRLARRKTNTWKVIRLRTWLVSPEVFLDWIDKSLY